MDSAKNACKTFTKECSMMIQGLSVIMMIFHHQFSIYFPHESLVLGTNLIIEQKAAWFCRICTSFFAFCSGYGICVILLKYPSLLEKYKIILIKICKFIIDYWFILICIAPLEIVKAGVGFGKIALAFTTYDTSFNGGWWYIRQYIYMLFFAPSLMEILLGMKQRKLCKIFVGSGISLGIFIVSKFLLHSGSVLFLIIFLIGMIASYLSVFPNFFHVFEKRRFISKLYCIIIIITGIVLRIILAKKHSDAWMDIFLAPIFSLSICYLYVDLGHQFRILEFLGKKSLWIWLISTVFQQVYEYEIKALYISELIIFVVYFVSIVFGVIVCILFETLSKIMKNPIKEKP